MFLMCCFDVWVTFTCVDDSCGSSCSLVDVGTGAVDTVEGSYCVTAVFSGSVTGVVLGCIVGSIGPTHCWAW